MPPPLPSSHAITSSPSRDDLEKSLSALEEEFARLKNGGKQLEASKVLEKVVLLTEKVDERGGERVSEACVRFVKECNLIAMMFLQSGKLNGAYQLLCKAEGVTASEFIRNFDLRMQLRATTFNNLGCLFKRSGRLSIALDHMRHALSIEQDLPRKIENPAATHLNLCSTYSELGDHNSALKHAQKALAIIQRMDSSNDRGMLAVAFHNVAVEQEHLGQFRWALVSYRHALDIAEDQWGKTHPKCAAVAACYEDCFQHCKNLELQSKSNNKKKKRGDGGGVKVGGLVVGGKLVLRGDNEGGGGGGFVASPKKVTTTTTTTTTFLPEIHNNRGNTPPLVSVALETAAAETAKTLTNTTRNNTNSEEKIGKKTNVDDSVVFFGLQPLDNNDDNSGVLVTTQIKSNFPTPARKKGRRGAKEEEKSPDRTPILFGGSLVKEEKNHKQSKKKRVVKSSPKEKEGRVEQTSTEGKDTKDSERIAEGENAIDCSAKQEEKVTVDIPTPKMNEVSSPSSSFKAKSHHHNQKNSNNNNHGSHHKSPSASPIMMPRDGSINVTNNNSTRKKNNINDRNRYLPRLPVLSLSPIVEAQFDVRVKCLYLSEIIVLMVSSKLNLREVIALVKDACGIAENVEVLVKYRDDENDLVLLTCESGWRCALTFAKSSHPVMLHIVIEVRNMQTNAIRDNNEQQMQRKGWYPQQQQQHPFDDSVGFKDNNLPPPPWLASSPTGVDFGPWPDSSGGGGGRGRRKSFGVGFFSNNKGFNNSLNSTGGSQKDEWNSRIADDGRGSSAGTFADISVDEMAAAKMLLFEEKQQENNNTVSDSIPPPTSSSSPPSSSLLIEEKESRNDNDEEEEQRRRRNSKTAAALSKSNPNSPRQFSPIHPLHRPSSSPSQAFAPISAKNNNDEKEAIEVGVETEVPTTATKEENSEKTAPSKVEEEEEKGEMMKTTSSTMTEEDVAKKLQSVARMRMMKKQKQKQQKEEEEKEKQRRAAAVKIQSLQRGRLVRKSSKQRMDISKGKESEEKVTIKEHKAAISIQRIHRGRSTRRLLEKRKQHEEE